MVFRSTEFRVLRTTTAAEHRALKRKLMQTEMTVGFVRGVGRRFPRLLLCVHGSSSQPIINCRFTCTLKKKRVLSTISPLGTSRSAIWQSRKYVFEHWYHKNRVRHLMVAGCEVVHWVFPAWRSLVIKSHGMELLPHYQSNTLIFNLLRSLRNIEEPCDCLKKVFAPFV